MTSREEVAADSALFGRTIKLAGAEMVLVGGQALAFWAAYYRLKQPAATTTKDIDFIGSRKDVERLAKGLGAQAQFPNKRSLTLLAGQVLIDVSEGQFVNIDVLKNVFGKRARADILRDSVEARNELGIFRVIHPLDMLQGRLDNTYKLKEKQDEHGLAQLRLAVDVTRAFLAEIASHPLNSGKDAARPVVLRHINRIESMARSDAGRKVAARYGIHVADAIDPAPVRHLKDFTARKLPQLLELMSADCRARLHRARP